MSPRAAGPPPLVHRFTLPEGTSEVMDVFVNGIRLRRGEDYEVRADHLWFHRGVRPARRLTGRDLLRIALCVEVVPEGDPVDALVRCDGRVTSVQVPPG